MAPGVGDPLKVPIELLDGLLRAKAAIANTEIAQVTERRATDRTVSQSRTRTRPVGVAAG